MGDSLPIIEVSEDNFVKVFPAIQAAIKDAAFVAVDCELTGIGEHKLLNYPEIDMRYQYTADIARNYAVISLGLSCFTCKSVIDIEMDIEGDDRIRSHDYLVQTFNVLTLCNDSFKADCKAIKFLLSHGFDFNKLYTKGLPYYRGCDRNKDETPNVRNLFTTILQYQKPIVIHNGLLDLAFLYQSFYADLPKKVDTFAADLTDMFPCGIYDTKYIAEFHQSLPATYLEYLYKRMQLKNARRGNMGDWHIRMQFPPYPKSLASVDWHPYLQIHNYSLEKDDDGLDICEMFAFHGWCSRNDKCTMSHDINKIVKILQPKGAKKRGTSKYSGPKSGSLVRIIEEAAKKELLETENGDTLDVTDTPTKKCKVSREINGNKIEKKTEKKIVLDVAATESTADPKVNGKQSASGHRAGFDAFMTGYIFAAHISEVNKLTSKSEGFTADNIGMSEQVNKVYLMGKQIPFLIRTGMYANMSANHTSKILKVRKEENG
ncbi:target of EGR1 protein 1 [Procambarus clarkii]|uniref:target of EGR1 protein 1 n=1 Tax=Procambarus clarkii TaxID=6728 RepID=UPI001E676309|nr:target of EGR1 protein 1-like [Procambarus clarkii]